ncbi:MULTISPECIES: polyprenyl synthetase family protein [unclassified Wenzhouxiangella]|uniref:polyprenyl synthetase family protein n=1 Tax=unclassified Wenzhouxiangella TaxID=2613841 RepID=UPI000E325315|nr:MULTISPECIES: farnesyl diphosphate synthase [unclassified Wenzhouxiangella]RFF27120.1 geranyl transferase [Wenzhouxiangella sp. 15181]RFP69194.1 geranyl transferase [Wenzhouxiangella sp. 15190]
MPDGAFAQRAETLIRRTETSLRSRLAALPANGAQLSEAMRYAALGGGKRLRPLLVYTSGEALGLPHDQLDAPAMAVELIHCYSLVHDDLPAMDDDNLRRGRPTVHLAFDEATAILAGDALQAMAFEILTEVGDATAARTMSAQLARACGVIGMAGGQALDLQFEGQTPQRAAVEDMFRRKTGALIHVSVMMPAALRPELEKRQYQALSRFADTIGLAFQIRDDLLEIESDTESIGKPSDSDASRRKASWPALFGIDAARSRIDELAEQAAEALTEVEGDTDGLEWLAERLINRRF